MSRVFLFAALLALGACGEAPEQKPQEARAVRVFTVAAQDAVRTLDYAGEVRARHETRLAFRVGGKIVERLVELGDVVRAGQALARLDPADLGLAAASAKAQVASLEAEHTFAEAELQRYRGLLEKRFISQAEYERRASAFATAQARLEAARAQSRQASNQLRYATLAADTPGVVTALEAEAGQVVSAGQTVLRLARPGEKEVVFAVPEAEREWVKQVHDLTVTLNARPGKSWQARLRELSPAADPVTRTYAARVTVLGPAEELALGMSARVSLAASGGGGQLQLPIAALHSRGDTPQVFLVQADGTVRAQPVRTAGIVGERVIVAAGLNPGDVVVAAGAQLLRPGQRVRILDER
jgi:membrane fusion protein, multidrug efflux system